jgi:hypothetical protein
MATSPPPDLQLACPVCAAFNPPDFRFCPHCGHRLGAPELVEWPPGWRGRLLRWCWTVVALAVAIGVGGLLWQRWRGFLGQQAPLPRVERVQPAAQAPLGAAEAPTSPPPAGGSVPAGEAADVGGPTAAPGRRALGAVVELFLFDREGDPLRQARGLLSPRDRRVITSFAAIHGAYSGYIRLSDASTPAISAVEQADPAADLAILALDPPAATDLPPTLEAVARLTYEDTAAEQRYLAEKRARAQRWEEAIAHWKRVIELNDALRREVEPALAHAFLQASDADLSAGRRAERHARLLDAVEWLPEHGELRLRLAGSFFELEEYREAIEHYWAAYELLPARAAEIGRAIVQVHRAWGQALLRQGEWSAAANLFREALQLDGANGGLYFGLGVAEFRRRAFEAAIQAFEAALAYEPGLRPEIEPYLAKARALQGGPRTVVIDFPPGSPRIEVPVVINGRLEVPFIIDTGASMTLMPAWAAEMLGYRPPPTSEWLRVQTAGGARRLPYAAVQRLEIQGLGLSNLPVLFGDLPGHDASRGLLGMDFLRHFSLAVDHELGRMTLRLR